MNQRLLAVAVLLYALGMGLFLNGFLLTKREIQRRSSAYDFHSLRGPAASLQQPSAVFLFVVDALRLDFMQEMNVSAADSQSAISYNRFTTVHQLLRENASHAALFGFRADPPTVTAQRLQALTAGGIPTFLDIRSNMDAARMAEDNWVAQLRAQGQRHLVFLGDDTWEALLPGLFDVSRPFYSFNTRDLYSADDGIERNLFKEMDRAPWDLMVAHFLGVDHVGHTHSAFHPIMRERLDRMDALVHEVIERLPEGGVLLLCGDHGMTDGGEHGGASPEETDAGLFVYRKPLRDEPQSGVGAPSKTLRAPPMISQIDLVPTLSLAMGLPVPYSSLGVLQPTLLSVLAPYSEDGLTAALFFNSLQVMRYLVQYSCSVDITPSLSPRHHGPLLNTEDIGATRAAVLAADPVCLGGVSILGAGHASVFPRDRMERLFARLLRALSAHEELSTLVRDGDLGVGRNGEQYSDREKALREDYLVFLRDAQALGREQWTQFNVIHMSVGLAMMVAVTVTVVWLGWLPLLLQASPSAQCYAAVSLCLCTWHAVSMLSNSFIIEEHWVLLFAVQTCAVMLVGARAIARPMSVSAALGWLFSLLGCARCMWALRDLPHVSVSDATPDAWCMGLSTLLVLGGAGMYVLRPRSAGNDGIISHRAARVSAALFAVQQAGLYLHWLAPSLPLHSLSVSLDMSPRLLGPRVVLVGAAAALLLEMFLCTTEDRLKRVFLHVCSVVLLLAGSNHASLVILLGLYACLSLRVLEGAAAATACPTEGSALAGGFALHCALLGRFAYMCSGQRLNFGALHLSVGFIGADSFHPLYAGLLLVSHMVGFDVLAAVTAAAGGAVCSRVHKDATHTGASVLWAYRAGMGAVAAVCGLVHRRHLMVWAVFAPKVLFEMFFSAIVGIVPAVWHCGLAIKRQ